MMPWGWSGPADGCAAEDRIGLDGSSNVIDRFRSMCRSLLSKKSSLLRPPGELPHNAPAWASRGSLMRLDRDEIGQRCEFHPLVFRCLPIAWRAESLLRSGPSLPFLRVRLHGSIPSRPSERCCQGIRRVHRFDGYADPSLAFLATVNPNPPTLLRSSQTRPS